jgi:hypothetical protein
MIRTLPAVGASPSAFGEHGSSWRQGMPLFNSVLARRTFGYLLAGTLALLAIIVASIWLAARTVNHPTKSRMSAPSAPSLQPC